MYPPPQAPYYGSQTDLSQVPGRYNDPSYGQDNSFYGNMVYQQYPHPAMQHANMPPPTPTTAARQQKALVLPAKETEQHHSPAQEHPHFQFAEPASNRDQSFPGERPVSPSEINWPAEKVQAWLSMHDFSPEWIAAFQHLNVQGAQFLDIGVPSRTGGQKNIGFMPKTVLPQVAREYTAKGIVWDQVKWKEEGRRLRKLVREVVQAGGVATLPVAVNHQPRTTGRRESNANQNSSNVDTDGATEPSPELTRPGPSQFGSTPTTAGGGEDSPGRTMPVTISQRRGSNQRALTLDSAGGSFRDNGRSNVSSHALSMINVEGQQRHSPSLSTGDMNVGSSKFRSPQQSPGLPNFKGNAAGSNQGRYDHIRSGSESIGEVSIGILYKLYELSTADLGCSFAYRVRRSCAKAS
jgi:mitogen-activated protein kinase kinase kinase